MTKRNFNWIDDLLPPVREAVIARAHLRTLPDASLLYARGDHTTEVFQVVKGEIRQFMLDEEGREVLLYIYRQGDVVADSAAIDGEPYSVSIATKGETVLRVWSVRDITELRARFPQIDAALACQMSSRLRHTLEFVQELVTMPVAARIAGRIVSWLQVRDGETNQEDFSLSQAEIAAMAGTTRQSVNRVIMEMKARNLIEAEYGRITVKDLEGLRRYKAERLKEG